MNKIICSIILFPIIINAQESCEESSTEANAEVSYNVDTSIPKHLRGAQVCIFKKDSGYQCVPAEKFMVVPRKQKTVLGENKTITKTVSCSKTISVSKKNTVYADVRKDHQDLSVTTAGSTATVESKRGLVPSVNYFRHNVLNSPLGLGIGVDTNGTFKGAVGIDF